MSLSTVTSVHCDDCGNWQYLNAGGLSKGQLRAQNLARYRSGWRKTGTGRDRKDYCPKCAPNHPELT